MKKLDLLSAFLFILLLQQSLSSIAQGKLKDPLNASSKPKKNRTFDKKNVLELGGGVYFSSLMPRWNKSDSSWDISGQQYLATAYFINGNSFRVGIGSGWGKTEANSKEGRQTSWQVPVLLSVRVLPGMFYLKGEMGIQLVGQVKHEIYGPTSRFAIINETQYKNKPFARYAFGLSFEDKIMIEAGYMFAPTPYQLSGKRQIPPNSFSIALRCCLD
ncbi:MAG: hypothetical protein IT247_03375 [Bacteroidia bacterium]|nr:hypothetical protein [Bacteroidia bacterium]